MNGKCDEKTKRHRKRNDIHNYTQHTIQEKNQQKAI